jgi:hypothetical protein
MIPDFIYEPSPSDEEVKQEYRDRLIPSDLYLLEHGGEILWAKYETNSPVPIPPAEPRIVKALLDEGSLLPRPAKNGARAYVLASG